MSNESDNTSNGRSRLPLIPDMKRKIYLKFALFASVIPFILLCYFDYPGGDDFTYLMKVLNHGFLKAQFLWYVDWSGRFFATGSMSLFIWVLTLFKREFFFSFYGAAPFFLLSGVFISFFIFLRTVSLRKLTIKESFWGALGVFIIYVSKAPSARDAFYALASGFTYQIANISILLLISLFVNSANITSCSRKQKLTYIFLCCLLTSAIMGCNEITLAALSLFIFVVAPYAIYKKPKNSFLWKTLLISGVIFALISALSPGNTMRAEILGRGHSTGNTRFVFSNSAIYSVRYAHKFIVSSIFSITLIGAIISFIPIAFSMCDRFDFLKKLKLKYFLAFLFLWLAIIAGSLFPNYWAGGYHPPPRVLNAVYFIFLAGFFPVILMLCSFASPVFKHSDFLKKLKVKYFLFFLVSLMSVVAVSLLNSYWSSGDSTCPTFLNIIYLTPLVGLFPVIVMLYSFKVQGNSKVQEYTLVIGQVIMFLGIFATGNFPGAVRSLICAPSYQRQVKKRYESIRQQAANKSLKKIEVEAFVEPIPQMIFNLYLPEGSDQLHVAYTQFFSTGGKPVKMKTLP